MQAVKPRTLGRDAGLFVTGFIQVFLVAMNTVYVAKGNYALAFVTSFGISYVWTRNVTRVAIGLERDRWLYASGAAFGCIAGIGLARYLLVIT